MPCMAFKGIFVVLKELCSASKWNDRKDGKMVWHLLLRFSLEKTFKEMDCCHFDSAP